VLSTRIHRRPGLQAPAWIVKKLKRRHPQVSLAWDAEDNCWALVAYASFDVYTVVHKLKRPKFPGEAYWLTGKGVAELPTMENTVWWLDKHDSRRWENEYDKRQWLDDIDSRGPHQEVAAVEARASGLIEEGADRAWRAAGKRIPFGGLRPPVSEAPVASEQCDNATQRPVPHRPGPAKDL